MCIFPGMYSDTPHTNLLEVFVPKPKAVLRVGNWGMYRYDENVEIKEDALYKH